MLTACRPLFSCVALAASLALAGCGGGAGDQEESSTTPAFEIRFEAQENPAIFDREGTARRSARDTSGLWAVVSGLSRAESAMVHNRENGRSVRVALFNGRPGGGTVAELSPQAAEALGIGESPVRVQVTAVRDEPQVQTPRRGFLQRFSSGE